MFTPLTTQAGLGGLDETLADSARVTQYVRLEESRPQDSAPEFEKDFLVC